MYLEFKFIWVRIDDLCWWLICWINRILWVVYGVFKKNIMGFNMKYFKEVIGIFWYDFWEWMFVYLLIIFCGYLRRCGVLINGFIGIG